MRFRGWLGDTVLALIFIHLSPGYYCTRTSVIIRGVNLCYVEGTTRMLRQAGIALAHQAGGRSTRDNGRQSGVLDNYLSWRRGKNQRGY